MMLPNFADPFAIGLILAVIPIIWLYIRRARRRLRAVPFPAMIVLRKIPPNRAKRYMRHVPLLLTTAILALLAIALARPQTVSHGQDVTTEGIDIVLALDISASMLAQDFRPDRVQAAKAVASEFIAERPDDRIGIVLFAKHAFTQCPLTIDHAILQELLDGVDVGLTDPDNTAIGSALAAAMNRLKGSKSKSRVIILLTDGENNFGLPPTTAAEAAEALGLRVYTIGVGTRGTAPYPSRDIFGRPAIQNVRVSIDEDLLRGISDRTGGRYFRATDETKLREIFIEIDEMEKSKIEVKAYRRYSELFYVWAFIALGLLTIGLLMQSVWLRGMV